MKTKLFLTAILTIGLATFANARIFRMGYPGTPLTGVDYSDMNTLQGVATAGDTVQIYGNIGGSYIVTKRLVFIGFGYNLDVHSGLQKNNSDAPSTASIYFYPGSDGSKAEGLSGSFTVGNQANSPEGASVSNISFTRCNGTFKLFTLYGNVSNVTFTSCVLSSSGMDYQGYFNAINITLFNCIFGGNYYGDFTMYNPGSSAAFFNCVSPPIPYGYGSIVVNNANVLVRNSILSLANSGNINTVYENCFFGQTQPSPLPLGTNNRWGQYWTELFQGITGLGEEAGYAQNAAFNENYYILKAGSPAINGGFSGTGTPTNCGIFGGEAAFAYKLGGVPAVPSISRLDAATLNASTNPYNVTISVRSNN